MARHGRYFLPDQPLHVIQRGNNRSAIFFDIEDYEHYRDWLAGAAVEYGCLIQAYVLMTNHVHLLVTPERAESLPRAMQSLGRRYVRAINAPAGAGPYGRGAIGRRRSIARPISWPAAAISSSTRGGRAWWRTQPITDGRATGRMRTVPQMLW
jgi:REP element-mobilizing transposase RayT